MSRIFLTSRSELKSDILRYLANTDTDQWEIMRLVPRLFKKFLVTDIPTDQQLLRDVYGEAVRDYEARKKCERLITDEELDTLILSSPVRKLFLKNWNQSLADERALEQIGTSLGKRLRPEEEEEEEEERSRHPDSLSIEEILELLTRNSPQHTIKDEQFKILDLTNVHNISQDKAGLIRSLKSRFQPWLQFACTVEERKWLLTFGSCKTQKDIDKLLVAQFSTANYTATLSYIRTAINCLSNLWRSGVLHDENNEGWLQANLYSQVFDAVFLEQSHWITRRSETISMTLKTARLTGVDVLDKKIDFVLKSKDDDVDVLSVEDKPKESKKVAADLEKTSIIQQMTLYLWRKRIGYNRKDLVAELEATTCQWTGSRLQIYGTRLFGSTFVYYKKADVRVPTRMKCGEAALALLTVISLKRALHLNYSKLEKMMEIRAVEQIANLDLQSSDSDYECEYFAANEEECLQEVRSMTFDPSILTNQDWEQLRRLKKRESAEKHGKDQE